MQAIILAAGMGKRLKELTSNATKCMVEVNGTTLIERVLNQLENLHLSKIILVVGYEAHKLTEYVDKLALTTPIQYVNNTIYNKTNNIYSLFLAKDFLLEEDTLLLESDIICEDKVLQRLMDNPYPSLALVAKYENWMDGTVVTLADDNSITQFISKKDFDFTQKENYYKTVNIYKFSKEFSASHYVPFLEAYCKALGNNEYYEQVLKVITLLDKSEIKAEPLEDELWYEIDDVQDLNIAESIFAKGYDKLSKMQKRFGGYWRYEHLLDFCYLVNPYYPCKKLKEELKSNFETLLCQYPSGMEVNSLLGGKYWGLPKEQICVGNGAAELIKSLLSFLHGSIGIVYPTFEEYPNRAGEDQIIGFVPDNADFTYTAQNLMDFYEKCKIETLLLINPDNPSGNYITKEGIIQLAGWCKEREICFIVDESFVDFAKAEDTTLLTRSLLAQFSNLVVIKSISKSYGVPGLRLGILASSDELLISQIKKDVAIWNVNSFGEFYLQIFEKYRKEYEDSLCKIKDSRDKLFRGLGEIPYIRPIPSEANYILCELTHPMTGIALAEVLLNQYQILIKDCSNKKGFEKGQYVRIAVRNEADNTCLLDALKMLEQQ